MNQKLKMKDPSAIRSSKIKKTITMTIKTKKVKKKEEGAAENKNKKQTEI